MAQKQNIVVSLFEQIAKKTMDGDTAIIGLAFEEKEEILDAKLAKFKTTTARFDAATVAAEVEEAQEMEEEMARQARQKLRDEKKAERKARLEEKKAKLAADWEGLKTKINS